MTVYRYRVAGEQPASAYDEAIGVVVVPGFVDVTVPTLFPVATLDSLLLARNLERISNADPAPATQTINAAGTVQTDSTDPQVKIDLMSGALAEGTYSFTWTSEIRAVTPAAGHYVRAELGFDNGGGLTVVSEDNWADSQWHTFASGGSTAFAIGATPQFVLQFYRVGGAPVVNPVEMRRARMTLQLEGP